MDRWDRREYQLIDLLTKPEGDVTVTDAQNVNHVIPSFLQLNKDVTAMTDELTGAVAEARAINSQSLAYSNAAHDAAAASEASAAEAAQSATDLAAAVAESTSQAGKSATSAAASKMSEDAAASSRVAADASRDAAKASETSAAASRDTAGFSATAAKGYRDDAQLARDLSSAYANAPVNSEVSPGKYSAFHWAEQARLTAVGAVVYKGSWSAAGGTMPAQPKTGDFYFISAAGTVGSIKYAVGDMAIYDGSVWERIDNQQAVTTVAGRTGAVVLTIADIASLQAALDAKLTNGQPYNVGSQGGGASIDFRNSARTATRYYVAHDESSWNLCTAEDSGAFRNVRVGVPRDFASPVTIDGQKAWHAGNFDPTTKANLAGANFTGRVSATGAGFECNRADGSWAFLANAADGKTSRGGIWLEADGVALVNAKAWSVLKIFDSNQLKFNGNTVWDAGNFDPNAKAPVDNPSFTGVVTVKNNSLRMAGWNGVATDGVAYFGNANSYIFKSGGAFVFNNEQGGFNATLNSGGVIWTANNVAPLDKNNGGTLSGSIFMDNKSAERQYGWIFSDRTTYLYGNPTNKDVGLYCTGVGTRWVTDANGNFTAGADVRARQAVRGAAIAPDNAAGANLTGNGSGITWNGGCYLAGPNWMINARSDAWVRVPRMFVQGDDPGSAASDGDLWIW